MKRLRLTTLIAIPLLCCCGKVNPIDPVVPSQETFTLNSIPELRVYTLGCAEISSKTNYTKGGSCVLEYFEASSVSGETVRRAVDFGGFSIKGRGNSTWDYYPKKPYLLKLDIRQEVLGMGKGRTWCLIANWMDKTLLRNDVAFEIASRCSGLDWTPEGEFVELMLNGKDMGLYYLCPHISVGKSRVDCGDDGVLFELDTYYDEPYKFRSLIDLPVMVKDFEVSEGGIEGVLSEERLNSIKDEFLHAESFLVADAPSRSDAFLEYFDLESLVDFYLVNELVGNGELYHPKSTYLYYNDKDAKYHFGPVWDFDWATLIPDIGGLIDRDFVWYKFLFKNPLFVSTLKERWSGLKPSLEDIEQYIRNREDWIEPLAEKNFAMWPISQVVNGDESLSFHDAVDRLVRSLNTRISEVDLAIASL